MNSERCFWFVNIRISFLKNLNFKLYNLFTRILLSEVFFPYGHTQASVVTAPYISSNGQWPIVIQLDLNRAKSTVTIIGGGVPGPEHNLAFSPPKQIQTQRETLKISPSEAACGLR